MTPPDRPKRRRNETRDLVMPIMAAVNDIPGVRVWRPHVLAMSARGVSGAGLANGSADLVGLCCLVHESRLGRFLGLEVKWPGEKPTADQRLWGEVVRKLGGLYFVVHSEDEATSAVRAAMGLT